MSDILLGLALLLLLFAYGLGFNIMNIVRFHVAESEAHYLTASLLDRLDDEE